MSPRIRALRAVRRVDESMNLLTDLSRDALDPGYRTAAPRRGRWWVVASATVVIGLKVVGPNLMRLARLRDAGIQPA